MPWDWLFDNPVATMRGPDFLAVYVGVSVMVLVAAGLAVRWLVPPSSAEPPTIEGAPSPYVVAFLRGGPPDVTRLAVADLMQRGLVTITDEPRALGLLKSKVLRAVSGGESAADLHPVAATLLETIGHKPRQPAVIFRSDFQTALREDMQHLETSLREEGLLTSEETLTVSQTARVVGSLLLIGLAGYKVAAAIRSDHWNLGFLVLLTAISVIVLMIVTARRRLTSAGRVQLKRWETAFADARTAVKSTTIGTAPEPAFLLGCALFGVAAMQGTAFASLHDAYHKAAASSGSGCGAGFSSSCGTGCGGGGGCGGGCGGCGG